MVRKVRAGHLRMAVTPLAFSPPPLHPPKGEFPTTRPQNAVCRRRARAFLCPSPITPPAFFPCRAQARASPAISAAPWTGTALAFPRAAFSSRQLPRPPPPEGARATPAPDGSVMSLAAVRKCRAGLTGCHAACNHGTGRAAGGVTALAFSAGVPPALQPVTSFALSIVSDSGCLWQPVMAHAPPARLSRSPG